MNWKPEEDEDDRWLLEAGFTPRGGGYELEDPVYDREFFIARYQSDDRRAFGFIMPNHGSMEAYAQGRTPKEVFEKLKETMLRNLERRDEEENDHLQ